MPYSISVIIRKNKHDPIFGELLEIICFDDFILFHIKVLEYMLYSLHYHAHVVSTERYGQKDLINPEDLLDYLPMDYIYLIQWHLQSQCIIS